MAPCRAADSNPCYIQLMTCIYIYRPHNMDSYLHIIIHIQRTYINTYTCAMYGNTVCPGKTIVITEKAVCMATGMYAPYICQHTHTHTHRHTHTHTHTHKLVTTLTHTPNTSMHSYAHRHQRTLAIKLFRAQL